MDTRPREHPRFALRLEGARGVLYDRGAFEYLDIGPLDAFYLSTTLELSAEDAAKLCLQEFSAVELESALQRLTRVGALGDDHRYHGDLVELPPSEGFSTPLVAHLGVTLACNFSCNHCYSSSGKRAKNELSKQEIEQLIDRLAELGIYKLVLGGGEPFIRKDLAALIRHARTRGLDVFVHTNASLLTEEGLEELALHPPRGLAVSLDGATAETNDVIRGEGTFERVMARLGALRSSYAPGFNISVTITPKNMHEASAMVDIAKREQANLLLLRPAYPAGEAAENDELSCPREVFAAAVEKAHARADAIGQPLSAPHPEDESDPAYPGFGCVAGSVVLGITPTGDVTPCLNLPGQFISGNIRNTDLADLWTDGASFTQLRGLQPNEQCQSCRHYDTCRGGCRVRALFTHGDLNAPDSWCHYEPIEGQEPVAAPKKRVRLRVLTEG